MSLLLVLAALVTAGLVVGVAAGIVGGGLAPAGRERPLAQLRAPLGRLGEHDVADLRLSTAVRGYRMDEVDAVLDRLRAELAAREEEHAACAGHGAVRGEDVLAPDLPDHPTDRPERG